MKLIIATLLAVTLTSPVLADDDGAKLFKKKCASCHSLEKGIHKTGPSLYNVFEAQAGTTDFKKYKALKDSDIIWTEENLSSWIENPKKFAGKNTSMSVKIKKESDRQDIIKYLKAESLDTMEIVE